MERTANKLLAIQRYLLKTVQPSYTTTDIYNGMHFTEFIKMRRSLNIMYPYKDDKSIFLIELQENDCVITCEMVNDICIDGYIFKNK